MTRNKARFKLLESLNKVPRVLQESELHPELMNSDTVCVRLISKVVIRQAGKPALRNADLLPMLTL